MDSHIKYIKGALVITPQNIKKRNQYQRKQQDFTVLVKHTLIRPLQYTKKTYSKQDKDKLQNNPKYLVYCTLLQNTSAPKIESETVPRKDVLAISKQTVQKY